MIGDSIAGVLLVFLSTVFEGFGETFLKRSASGASALLIGVSIAFFAVDIAIYSLALRFVALSIAFPAASVSFVITALLSQWLLGERVTRVRWMGIGLILVGTSLIVSQA